MDEFSVVSSSQKSLASQHDDQEESGWTAYIEDFYNNNSNNGEDGSCSSFAVSPSLISDAATGASKKGNQIAGSDNFPKKLRCRKSRTKEICQDDSLEDTASSPVNSPKVSDVEQIQMNPRQTDDCTFSSSFVMGKESDPDRTQDDRNFNGKNDLRSRGLCLVPVSMLVDYNST